MKVLGTIAEGMMYEQNFYWCFFRLLPAKNI